MCCGHCLGSISKAWTSHLTPDLKDTIRGGVVVQFHPHFPKCCFTALVFHSPGHMDPLHSMNYALETADGVLLSPQTGRTTPTAFSNPSLSLCAQCHFPSPPFPSLTFSIYFSRNRKGRHSSPCCWPQLTWEWRRLQCSFYPTLSTVVGALVLGTGPSWRQWEQQAGSPSQSSAPR